MKDEGYEVSHDGKCITVFSAPNYWYVTLVTLLMVTLVTLLMSLALKVWKFSLLYFACYLFVEFFHHISNLKFFTMFNFQQ